MATPAEYAGQSLAQRLARLERTADDYAAAIRGVDDAVHPGFVLEAMRGRHRDRAGV